MRHYVGSIPILGVSEVQVLMSKFIETMVKRIRHRLYTAVTRVQLPLVSLQKQRFMVVR